MSTRYSDMDLQEFKLLIERKLERAERKLAFYQEQITEINENREADHADISDESNLFGNLEMLTNFLNNQRKEIQEFQLALKRIEKKTFGICEVTGKLIDKRRLLALPGTTKSLEGIQLEEQQEAEKLKKKNRPASGNRDKASSPKVISKIVKAPSKPKQVKPEEAFDFDDFEEEEEANKFIVSLENMEEDITFEEE